MDFIILIIILVFSVVVHEVSHGLVAEKLGDPTARLAGRLTLNPIPHIDPFGSILLPLFLSIAGLVPLGAAKPVPVNYANLRNPKRDTALVALAGPGSNFLVALACALPLRFGLFPASGVGAQFLIQVVIINLALGIFNSIPVPPLDGSKILTSFLADRFLPIFAAIERYGIILLILLVYIPTFQLALVTVIDFFLNLFLGPSYLRFAI